MTIRELRKKMKQVYKEYPNDHEASHSKLDTLLLEFINDTIVTKIYNEKPKW